MPPPDPTLHLLTTWAADHPAVRAVILTSTRAVPGASVDPFSDYDVILILTDITPFHAGRDWLAAFGPVLALYRDPLTPQDGYFHSGYVVQFDSDLKIDFTLWPVGLFKQIALQAHLPPELDAGYQVLLDKDNLTAGLQPPTYRGYIPSPPTETEYFEDIEQFFLTSIYVAKYLWRGDLIAAKYVLDTYMKDEHLRPMLVWHLEIAHNWTAKIGPYGRGLQNYLRPDLYAALAATYTGPALENNWQALYRAIDLMRKTALEVGAHFGYPYPHHLHTRALARIRKIQSHPHPAARGRPD